MADTFKQTVRHDYYSYDCDVIGLGHTQQRTKERKKQRRRARRVLKQELKKELER